MSVPKSVPIRSPRELHSAQTCAIEDIPAIYRHTQRSVGRYKGITVNWDAFGAIAEVLGALAVIVSIVYLAAQVRHTRFQLQAQAEDNIISRAFDAYSPLYEGQNVTVFRRGLQSPVSLNEDEAFLFQLLMDRQRGAFASVVRRLDDKAVTSELSFRMLQGYKKLFLETEGGRHWLDTAKQSMSNAELHALGLEP